MPVPRFSSFYYAFCSSKKYYQTNGPHNITGQIYVKNKRLAIAYQIYSTIRNNGHLMNQSDLHTFYRGIKMNFKIILK